MCWIACSRALSTVTMIAGGLRYMHHTMQKFWSMFNMIRVLDRSDNGMEYWEVLWDLPSSGLVIQGVKGCKEVPENMTRSKFSFDSWDM